MIQGFYSAATALKYRQKGIDINANNIANINTAGFKKSKAEFEDALYSAYQKEYPDNQSTNFSIGNGSYISNVSRDMTPGRMQETNNNLDIAIEGQGFVGIADYNNNVSYTRGGSFTFQPAAYGKYIADDKGNCLLDQYGQKIVIPNNVRSINIDIDGNIIYEGQQNRPKIMTANFNNPQGLNSKGMGIYEETQQSGTPLNYSEVKIRQGFLELSNTDLASEMVDLIKNQRIFGLNAKVIQTTDEIESMANKLRR